MRRANARAHWVMGLLIAATCWAMIAPECATPTSAVWVSNLLLHLD